MMFEITYWQLIAFITIIWIFVRLIVKSHSLKRELLLLSVYFCIIAIARIVYFPWRLVNGKIGTLHFDSSLILPFWINVVPFVHLFDAHKTWLMNIVGNITMFIPVGIIWPLCFKKLDNVGKVVLTGSAMALFIEITQLVFYERCSDIDDMIMNTAGVLIGALIFFFVKWIYEKRKPVK